MENKGLVKTDNNLDRRKSVGITVTERGQQAYYMSTGRESIHRTMSPLSEEEHQQLRSCLRRLREKALRDLVKEWLRKAEEIVKGALQKGSN